MRGGAIVVVLVLVVTVLVPWDKDDVVLETAKCSVSSEGNARSDDDDDDDDVSRRPPPNKGVNASQ